MPTIYELKPKFQDMLRPFVGWLAGRGVTANQVTITAMVLSVAAGLLVAANSSHRWPLLIIPVVLAVRMALNAVDGMLAREHDQKSALGAILNEVGDVVSDTALYLPFALVAGISAPWIVSIVILAIITEFTGIVGVGIGASRRYDGPMGKSDRAFVMGCLALYVGLGMAMPAFMNVLLGVVALLLVVTTLNRAGKALKELG